MDKTLLNKERHLEEEKVDTAIQRERSERAELKAAEHEMKKKYGTNWRQILGVKGKDLMSIYAVDPSLRQLTMPIKRR